jgi:hypothetical protein
MQNQPSMPLIQHLAAGTKVGGIDSLVTYVDVTRAPRVERSRRLYWTWCGDGDSREQGNE